MNLEVRLELLSDAAPGSGAGGPQVDREVVTDSAGLPLIPGRRLKGLLREAAEETIEALTLAGQRQWLEQELCPVATLFGTPTTMALAQIGDARCTGMENEAVDGPEGAQALSDWLAWANERHAFGAGAVRDALTVIRRQTAIDPDTGAARENALRSTRMVRQGLRFAGPVTIAATDPRLFDQARRTLALAAAALRQLGTSRHRGAGRVQVTLWDDAGQDWTQRSLQGLDVLVGKKGSQ